MKKSNDNGININEIEKEECPICEEYTARFIGDVKNGKTIESEYYCPKCGTTFAKVKKY